MIFIFRRRRRLCCNVCSLLHRTGKWNQGLFKAMEGWRESRRAPAAPCYKGNMC